MKGNAARPKVGLALSGGSALGTAHIGVLQSLVDHHVPIDCIAGTSAGALVAACYAFGMPPDEMAKRVKKLSWFSFFKFSYSTLGLVTNRAVGDMVKDLIGDVEIEEARIPLAIMATDLGTGEKVVLREGNVAQAVMASTCLPGLFVPVEWGTMQLVDGGLVENLPLSPLVAMNADVKIGVNLERWRSYKPPRHIVDVLLTSVDIVSHSQRIFPVVADVMIEPHLEEYTQSDWNRAGELVATGYRTTTNAIPAIMEHLESKGKKGAAPARTSEEGWFERLWRKAKAWWR